MSKPKVLFVCSRNEWRSRTAETIFRNDPRFFVKSAGTSAGARIRVSATILRWADRIFVMEDRHKKILLESFGTVLEGTVITVLDIPDEYPYMDPELIEELNDVVDHYL